MIEGRIELATEPAPFMAADVHIRVEDTTYLDVAAHVLFHHLMSGVSSADLAKGLSFTLDYAAQPPAGRTHTLSVLVDVDRDGRPGRGDYISHQAVRVPAAGAVAVIPVTRIG
jgi:hypothetical protein